MRRTGRNSSQARSQRGGSGGKGGQGEGGKGSGGEDATATEMVEAEATAAMSVPKPATRSTDIATAQQLNRRTQRATPYSRSTLTGPHSPRPHPISDAKANAAQPLKQPTPDILPGYRTIQC
mmetsp:Transcript_27006/g.68349  ORF Transcript_27006/g.68349 Transcript_27006/m.68349 type:complete len:122 (+) Transcript_27006:835-1200(+)